MVWRHCDPKHINHVAVSRVRAPVVADKLHPVENPLSWLHIYDSNPTAQFSQHLSPRV
jgi:hypothetical protein